MVHLHSLFLYLVPVHKCTHHRAFLKEWKIPNCEIENMFELFDVDLFMKLTKNLRLSMIGDSLNTQFFRSIVNRLTKFRVKNSNWVKARGENEDYNAELIMGLKFKLDGLVAEKFILIQIIGKNLS